MSTPYVLPAVRMSRAMNLTDKHQRLRYAREQAGFTSATEAASSLGVKASTYYAHENGDRGYFEDEARHYGRRFKVQPEWLIFGIGNNPGPGIREVDVRAGAGGGGIGELMTISDSAGISIAADAIRDIWQMPDSFMRDTLRVDTAKAWIVEINGDSGYDPMNSNAPGSLFPGDRVIIDTADRRPSPPGPFAVYDGFGLVIKQVEFVHQSDPPRIRLSSRNPSYSPYEIVEGEGHIIGRVRGRISAM